MNMDISCCFGCEPPLYYLVIDAFWWGLGLLMLHWLGMHLLRGVGACAALVAHWFTR